MPHVHAHRGRKRSHLGDTHQLLPCAPPSPTPPPLRVARAVHERRGLRPLAALPAPLRPRLRRSDRTADRMPVYERQWLSRKPVPPGRRLAPILGGNQAVQPPPPAAPPPAEGAPANESPAAAEGEDDAAPPAAAASADGAPDEPSPVAEALHNLSLSPAHDVGAGGDELRLSSLVATGVARAL